jgi:hypothetical protein
MVALQATRPSAAAMDDAPTGVQTVKTLDRLEDR